MEKKHIQYLVLVHNILLASFVITLFSQLMSCIKQV